MANTIKAYGKYAETEEVMEFTDLPGTATEEQIETMRHALAWKLTDRTHDEYRDGTWLSKDNTELVLKHSNDVIKVQKDMEFHFETELNLEQDTV